MSDGELVMHPWRGSRSPAARLHIFVSWADDLEATICFDTRAASVPSIHRFVRALVGADAA